MRDRARAVVIGGGVGGCAVLYWLARLGWDDVVLVERAELTSGSTFHSAGLVGQLRSSLSLTRMMMSSVDLYRSLESEVGLATGWREVGSLRLASSEERVEEIARQAGWAKTFG
ncbi:MAG: FAD-binding oxidoreductase, partial [Actinobacteria bacterium]|nr:FAD-binding oxidoreductase [Actinomycetota bacterium]